MNQDNTMMQTINFAKLELEAHDLMNIVCADLRKVYMYIPGDAFPKDNPAKIEPCRNIKEYLERTATDLCFTEKLLFMANTFLTDSLKGTGVCIDAPLGPSFDKPEIPQSIMDILDYVENRYARIQERMEELRDLLVYIDEFPTITFISTTPKDPSPPPRMSIKTNIDNIISSMCSTKELWNNMIRLIPLPDFMVGETTCGN